MIRLIEIAENGAALVPGGDIPDVAIDICLAYEKLYKDNGFVRPWVGYLAVRDDPRLGPELIGTCGFKSPPKGSRVEISYYTFPDFQGRGLGREMAETLVKMARDELEKAQSSAIIIAAQTRPQENASTSILKKLGFRNLGTLETSFGTDVWEWQLDKRT